MKLRNIMSFAMDEIVGKVKQFLLITIVFAVGIVLLGVSIFLYESTSLNADISDKSLSHGNAGTYYSQMEMTAHNIVREDTVDKMRKVEGIDSAGYFLYSELDSSQCQGIEQIVNLQKDSPYKEKEGSVQCINVNYGALGLINAGLKDNAEFEKPESEDVQYIYLGNKLSDIPVGTTFIRKYYYKDDTDEHMQSKDIKMVVKGYIEDDCRIVNTNVIYRNAQIKDYYYNMDYLFLCVRNDDTIVNDNAFLMYNIKDGYDITTVRNEINKIAEDEKLTLIHSDFKEAFESRQSTYMRMYSYVVQLAAIVLLTVIVLQICMQAMNIIGNARNYGIMYANGVCRADLRGIIIAQSFIKYITSLLLAVVLFIIGFIVFVGIDDKAMLNELIYAIKEFVLSKLFVVSFGIMVIGTIVPMIFIEKMTPISLIKNKD